MTSVPATVAITASAAAGPASRSFPTTPLRPGGTSTRYPIPPGTATDPRLSPSPREVPVAASGVKSYSGSATGVTW